MFHIITVCSSSTYPELRWAGIDARSPRQEDYWLGPRKHYKYCHSAHRAAHSCTPGAKNTHPYAAHNLPNHAFTLIKLMILQTNHSRESGMKWKDCVRVSIHSDDITPRSPIIKQHVGRHSGEIISFMLSDCLTSLHTNMTSLHFHRKLQ